MISIHIHSVQSFNVKLILWTMKVTIRVRGGQKVTYVSLPNEDSRLNLDIRHGKCRTLTAKEVSALSYAGKCSG